MRKDIQQDSIDEIEKMRTILWAVRSNIATLSDELLEDDDLEYFVRNILTYSAGLADVIEAKLKDIVYLEFTKGNLDNYFANNSKERLETYNTTTDQLQPTLFHGFQKFLNQKISQS